MSAPGLWQGNARTCFFDGVRPSSGTLPGVKFQCNYRAWFLCPTSSTGALFSFWIYEMLTQLAVAFVLSAMVVALAFGVVPCRDRALLARWSLAPLHLAWVAGSGVCFWSFSSPVPAYFLIIKRVKKSVPRKSSTKDTGVISARLLPMVVLAPVSQRSSAFVPDSVVPPSAWFFLFIGSHGHGYGRYVGHGTGHTQQASAAIDHHGTHCRSWYIGRYFALWHGRLFYRRSAHWSHCRANN